MRDGANKRLGVSRKKLVVGFFAIIAVILLCNFSLQGMLFVPAAARADGEPDVAIGSGFNGNTGAWLTVSGAQLTGDAIGDVSIYVKTTSGSLRMSTVTGLTFTGSQIGKKLVFSGTKTNINNALATLQFQGNTPATSTITIGTGGADSVYYPGNGHIYEIVSAGGEGEEGGGGITWNDAKTAAEARTMNGAHGYLATITSQGENDYITARMSGDGWFGASDAETEGDWKWVTGPEADTMFWQGLGNGTLQSGQFANWANAEPNNSGNEDCAQFYGNGSGWNDLPCSYTLGSYVVEYGAPGDMPTQPKQASLNVVVSDPVPQNVSLSTCQQFFNEYVDSNEHRFDNISLATNLDCNGETIKPMFADYYFNDGEEGFVPVSFMGTFNGNGHTIDNLNIESKEYNDGNESSPTGLFANVGAGAEVKNIRLGSGVNITGHSCVGGIVGSASSASIDNTRFSGEIDGNNLYRAGGVVGCIDSYGGDASVENSTFDGQLDAGNGSKIGGVIGTVSNENNHKITVEDSYNNGTISNFTSDTGGVIGYAYVYGGGGEGKSELLIQNNTVSQAITTSNGGNNIGGVIGYAENSYDGRLTIQDMHLSVGVSGGSYVGGIVGYLYCYVESDINDCLIQGVSSTGNISGNSYTGGIVGYSYGDIGESDGPGTKIFQSYATGNVSNASSYYAGGLIGYAGGSLIEQSFATGNVSIDDDQAAGGLVGFLQYSRVKDSYARGSVVTKYGQSGGLVGYSADNTIESSYSTGAPSYTADDGQYPKGGLIGYIPDGYSSTTTQSFWDTQTSDIATSANNSGTGKTTGEMKDIVTFSDWDIESIWGKSDNFNDGYMCLQWYSGCNGSPQDQDSDGIDDAVEGGAPNNGDGNNDSVADSQQDNVASFVNPVTGKYITLVVDSGCQINLVSASAQSSTKDQGFSYPLGLLDFTLHCSTPGYTAHLSQYYHGTQGNFILRKYNSNSKQYGDIVGATISTEQFAGQSILVAKYDVKDGSSLDLDGAEDGVIIDPVGMATITSVAPNTGLKRTSMVPFVVALIAGTGLAVVALSTRRPSRLIRAKK